MFWSPASLCFAPPSIFQPQWPSFPPPQRWNCRWRTDSSTTQRQQFYIGITLGLLDIFPVIYHAISISLGHILSYIPLMANHSTQSPVRCLLDLNLSNFKTQSLRACDWFHCQRATNGVLRNNYMFPIHGNACLCTKHMNLCLETSCSIQGIPVPIPGWLHPTYPFLSG